MKDLAQIPDDAIGTADELGEAFGVRPAVIRRLPIEPLAFPCRPRRYLAGDVKRAILGKPRMEKVTALRRAS